MCKRKNIVYRYHGLKTCDLVENEWLSNKILWRKKQKESNFSFLFQLLTFGIADRLNNNAYDLLNCIE